MSDFNATRDALAQARAKRADAADALLKARDRLSRVKARQGTLARSFDAKDPAQAATRDALTAERAAAETAVTSGEASLAQLRGAERIAVAKFAAIADPRTAISRLGDDVPFLLFPVRLETRFKTGQVAHAAEREPPRRRTRAAPPPPQQSEQQLWVRVYPDTCSIDTFEPELSDTEVASGQAYWGQIWQAGGQEDQERGAWRGLVASHGSGRAAWIVKTYLPVNLAEKPAKADPDDLILTVTGEAAIATQQWDDIATYWKAAWLAKDDAAALADANDVLTAQVGADRFEEVVATLRPVNFAPPPLREAPPPPKIVSAAYLQLPPGDDAAGKSQSWSRAPKAALLPDRFVLLAYGDSGDPMVVLGQPVAAPLVVGPDPQASEDEQLKQLDGELRMPDEMKWMVDFDRAVSEGMGFRVPLSAEQAQKGFKRLLVLGVGLSGDPATAKAELETLIEHHRYGRSGFQILPQGTPTNNTETGGSGFKRGDDPDASFDALFKNAAPAASSDWLKKSDGQWFAECLGIDPAVLAGTPGAAGMDQAEARAMNTALWPSTIGYWMDTMMSPVFSDQAVESTRLYFTQYVSGRGIVPAVRIGRLPYGIVPATAYGRMHWLYQDTHAAFASHAAMPSYLRQLLPLLRKVDGEWAELVKQVSHVGKAGDAHQILLDIMGLNSGAVEYTQRFAKTAQQLFNEANLGGFGELLGALVLAGLDQASTDLLAQLGYSGDKPAIMEKYYLGKFNALTGPLIDDKPLSESDPVRAYTASGKNYIEWLIDAARSSADDLRLQKGFANNKAPNALLYLMLRHALEMGAHEASLLLYRDHGLMTAAEITQLKREPAFIHVTPSAPASESRYAPLYRTAPAITNSPTLLMGNYIASSIGLVFATRYLNDQLRALDVLKDTPTARLERVFAEHIDCCTYRLDAWVQGYLHVQLTQMRAIADGSNAAPEQGLHLGAYAWLENVRPENKAMTPVHLRGAIDKALNPAGAPPLTRDSTNEGYVHAPSLNHAVAAAILRNGYISDADPKNPDMMAVNLSSDRVRTGLSLLEGIRGGQNLSALLGYQFERGLHDGNAVAEVDQYIFDLRKAFPLVADRLKSTKSDPGTPIEAVAASNVVDGMALAAHVKTAGTNFASLLPGASPKALDVIGAQAALLLASYDAVADLALAEGVYQAVMGNYDRVASTLDSYSKGHFPPDPDVVKTPRNGLALTHRVSIQLESGRDPNTSPVPGLAMTPRAMAEPALNAWAAAILPSPERIGCVATYVDAAGAAASVEVTLRDLALQPIDLLHIVPDDARQDMTELNDRIVSHVVETAPLRADAGVTIAFMAKLAADISIFEALPLLRALRRLTFLSRPLRASDCALSGEADSHLDDDVSIDPQRVTLGRDVLQALRDDCNAFAGALAAPLADPVANRAAIVAGADATMDQAVGLFRRGSQFGLPHSGWGFAFAWRRSVFATLMDKIALRTAQWQDDLATFDTLIAKYDALPASAGNDMRFEILRRAESEVSIAKTDPLPADADAFRATLLGLRTTFAARRQSFLDILSTTRSKASDLLDDTRILLPVTDIDPTPLTLDDEETATIVFVQETQAVLTTVMADIDGRLAASQAALAASAAAINAPASVKALQDAAKALFGEHFVVLPEFGLKTAQAAEMEAALADGADGGPLLSYLQTSAGVDLPVEEWFTGVARVREKLRTFEQVAVLGTAFGAAEPVLSPAQIPYQPNDSWLALQFPADYAFDSQRLLYTAHHAVPFQKSARQCGLLLDEWSEVVPKRDVTTGITFHYDRPNSEPAQAMLLVTPPEYRGAWQWADLVDALNDTLDRAKRRAVEPVHVDSTPYARFLPATITAVTVNALTITLNLALNNAGYQPGGH
jgi:hypothetical protein